MVGTDSSTTNGTRAPVFEPKPFRGIRERGYSAADDNIRRL